MQVQVVDSDQGRMARPRMLPPGQRIDVWLELNMPESHHATSGDVFQARCVNTAPLPPACHGSCRSAPGASCQLGLALP